MLSFFVLLNAYAQVEHNKAQHAIDSLRQSFVGESGKAPDVYETGLTKGQEANKEMLPDLRQYLLKAYPKALDINQPNPVTVEIAFPAKVIFKGGSLYLTTGAEEALIKIQENLTQAAEGHSMRLRIMMSTADNSKEGTDLAVDRAATLAKYFADHGAETEHLAVGIQSDTQERAIFRFIDVAAAS
jgi:hypothetical protein